MTRLWMLPSLSLVLLALAAAPVVCAQTFSGDFSLSSGAVYQTAGTDEALAVAVDTFSAGGPYIYVGGDSGTGGVTVKLSSAGVALASAPFVSVGSGVVMGAGVDPSGNVWTVGYLYQGAHTDWRVMKSDANLVPQVSTVIAGATLGANVAKAIVFDASGNAYVAGYSSQTVTGTDFRIVKYSPAMSVLASVTVGGAGIEQANALALDSIGNVIVAGLVDGVSPYNYFTVKLSSSFVVISSAVYDAAGGSDRAYGVAVDPSDNIYVTGETDSGGANYAATTIKYNSSLAQQGVVSYNTSAHDTAFAALFVGTNTLVVVGDTYSGATEDMVMLTYDSSLVLQSSSAYDSGFSDRANAVAKGTGTYLYVSGYSYVPSAAYRTLRLNTTNTAGSAGATAPAAPTGFAGVAQSSTAVNWTWTDASTDETGFRVKRGGSNLSGDLAADVTSWLQTGLTPNATSGSLLAQAFNSTGTADSGAAQVYSLTDPPNSITATFYGSSCAFTWPAMANPPSTRWSVERGTDGVSYATQLYFSSAAAAYTDTAMLSGTTYYYRIRSANGDGVYSAHANASAIVYTGNGPAQPSGFAGTAQSTSSILWSWNDNSATESGYRIMFGGTNVSGNLPANTTTWLQTGLAVNTSSGALFAQVFNSTGVANSASVTRYSLAAVPTGLVASGVTSSSATLTWGGSATLYQLERSTGAGFAVIASSAVTTFGNTGLAAASTYYYRILGLNGDSVATAYASSITVITLPVVVASSPTAPSAFAGTAQSTSSILWSWTDNSNNETGFRVMAGTANVSGSLAANATTWLQNGLAVNTSSGALFVQAFNSTGTADSGSLTRYSLASVPAGLASSSVFQTSATVSWAGSATLYQLERSTGAGFTIVSTGAATSYGDTALAAASTYYYRVLGQNGDAVATAYASSITVITAPTPLPSAPTGFAGTAASTSSILWSWTDAATNETGYRVLSGTISLSGNLAADTTAWLQSGLGANALTGPLSVQGFNVAGSVNSGTASRTTLAAVPGTPAAAGVALTSATLSWSNGGNPGGTTFELERSTGAGYGLLLTGSATTYFDGYLIPSATHYYRVRAVNGEAVASAYSSSAAVVALPAPPVPGAAGAPVGTALGTSSVTWTWVLASGATNHFLFRASDNSFLGSSASGPFVQTALSPNVPYGLRAAGVNVGGTGPLSPSASVYTLAAVPAAPAASTNSATSLSLSWGLNGNPVATLSEVLRSTNAVVYSTLAVVSAATATDSDLVGCTTYYYKVRHVNGNGLPTAYATFQGVTANTVPSPPSAFTAAANSGGTIGLSWSLSQTEGITAYRLFWDSGSGTVSYGAPLATLGPTAASYTTGVLTSSAAYTFALRAVHRCGVEETTGALAMSGAAVAAPALRAAIKEPDSGKRIHGNRVTLLGELIYGTPGDAQQVLFQYKLAASTGWTNVPAANVNHSNPDLSFPYFVHWNVNLLAPGDYDLRAVAYNRDGVPDAAPPAVRVTVVAAAVNADIDENDDNGAVKKEQTIANGVTSVIDTAGAGASDPSVRVSIPAGAVNASTATISVTANPAITTAAPSGQTLVGSAIKIDLSNGQSALNGTAAITLTYPDTVLFPSLLQIYYLNEATGQWSRDFASTVDTASRTVTGNTPHFSTFALLLGSSFAANLDSVQVYPVPFKPNGTNADEGRPFSAGDPNSGIIFSNLAMGSEIKIYTLTGRLVSSLDNAPITGTIRWDARNQDGRDVASGAYFAVIKASGQKTVVKKLVIIR